MALWNGFKKVIAITASDTVNENTPIDGLIVTTTGNFTVLPLEGAATAFVGIPAGVFIPIKVKRVNLTGLTAVVVGVWGQ